MKVATILVPLTEVLSIYRNTSLLSGGEKMDFTVFIREESEELFDMMLDRHRFIRISGCRQQRMRNTEKVSLPF